MLRRWAALPLWFRWLSVIAAAALVLAAAWALFVPLADSLARHDVGPAGGPLHETAVDNARGRLLTLGAGLAAVAALVFTALNFSLLRRNSEQADQWQRRTHELTEQGQVTDRYTKAIEQLGSKELDVRIGGIYALERVARDSPRDHPIVMEVLTAFIRERSLEKWPLPRVPEEEDEDVVNSTRPDIQAALTVVGRRDAKHDIGSIDLTGADLTGANLADANLVGASMVRASLVGADLTHADLTGADLTGAFLTGAHLTRANLAGADLARADLGGARLADADLTGAHFTLAGLPGTSASLTDADLGGADLTGTDLTRVALRWARLGGARWPAEAPVPEGWELDDSGRLRRALGRPRPAGED